MMVRERILKEICLTLIAASCLAATGPTEGQKIFSSTCAACHGLDGRGGEHAPNIATEPRVQGMDDDALAATIRKGIPAAGMPGFGSSLQPDQIRAVVSYLRALNGGATGKLLTGDAARGKALFFGRARCADCHMVGGSGGFLASDLSSYGHTHSAEGIRKAILDPNEDGPPRTKAVTVITREGAKYRGALRNEDNFSLQMQTADGRFHLFDKADLKQIEHEKVTLMPSDYGSKLTGSELDDLIRFLSNGTQALTEKEADDDDQD
jgi:putative heme-binding domain-containing protein